MRRGYLESERLDDPHRTPPGDDDLELEPLQPRRDAWSQRHVRWQSAPPRGNESVRWQSLDERWVAIAMGDGDELGCAVVTSSEGQRAVVDSYEAALVVAETWRS
jgi:hypothetical protein